MLLYAAGETLDDTTSQQPVLLRTTTEVSAPEYLTLTEFNLDLKHVCRQAIRRYLLKMDPLSHLFSRISQLGLPPALREYLLYGQSLIELMCS